MVDCGPHLHVRFRGACPFDHVEAAAGRGGRAHGAHPARCQPPGAMGLDSLPSYL